MEILQCLAKNRLYNTMLRIRVFSIFAIKKPRALTAHASLGLLNREDTDECTNTYIYLHCFTILE